jgi:hypothetical protein
VTVNVTPFVPKAHTPFQRRAQIPAKVIKRRLSYVEQELRPHGIGVKSESPAWAEIQGTLSRGDRAVAEALLAVDRVTPSAWRQALADVGLSAQEFLRPRSRKEPLPWDFIQSGIRASYLEREARRAGALRISPPCPPDDCALCGVCK